MIGPQGIPRGSPGVAVDLHRISWGILLALVEAGTSLQGHTLVFMANLPEKKSSVSRATGTDITAKKVS